MNSGYSRRDFLRTSALSLLGAAAGAPLLAACTSKTPGAATASSSASTAATALSSAPSPVASSASASALASLSAPPAAGAPISMLLPGDIPPGWSAVRAAINTKMKADLGFTMDEQFISFTNYANQELLKFTAGDKFDQALEARWLHLDQLTTSHALQPLNSYFDGNAYPNLAKTVSPLIRRYAEYQGELYVVPQVNYASYLSGFVIRQDLATKYGMSSVESYEDFERYLYAIKQHETSMIPFGLDNGYVDNTVTAQPTALFNVASWEDPTNYLQPAGPNAGLIYISPTAAKTGSSSPQPFWEAPGVMDALNRVRKYYLDGIINHDVLNADFSTNTALFGQGKYGAGIGNTDGLTSVTYGGVSAAVKGASIAQVVPLAKGMAAKPAATYSASNNIVIPKSSQHAEEVMKLQDWLSIADNHDLVAYGVEGKDWIAHGTDQYQSLSKYTFPTFALCWRIPLERTLVTMADTDKAWFNWAKSYDNFVPYSLAGFLFDQTPVKTEVAQLTSAFGQFGPPLFAGSVDVTSGLSKLQKAFASAGFDKIMAEMQSQADAFLKAAK
jgi:putative aldouronate transport system substrate-binding protein